MLLSWTDCSVLHAYVYIFMVKDFQCFLPGDEVLIMHVDKTLSY